MLSAVFAVIASGALGVAGSGAHASDGPTLVALSDRVATQPALLRPIAAPALTGLREGEFVLGPGGPGEAADPRGSNCPENTIRNTNQPGRIACTCFVQNEEAGVTFQAPASHYPIQILRIGIGWGSPGGASPDSLEDAILIYTGGLPSPGGPLSNPTYVIDSPLLRDGFINEYPAPVAPTPTIINSGPFTITLKFANRNAPPPAGLPTVVHDGAGCVSGKNVLRIAAPPILPFGWYDACSLGVSGNWQFQVVYKRVTCPCPGDVNGDGRVDFFDLNQVLAGYGTIYNFITLNNVLAAFGQSC